MTWSSLTILDGGLSRTLVPGWHPAGSNDPTCRLTPARPRPVVLVNFTTGSGWEWGAGSPYLRNNGFCVFSYNYGNITPLPNFPIQAIGDIRRSAQSSPTSSTGSATTPAPTRSTWSAGRRAAG